MQRITYSVTVAEHPSAVWEAIQSPAVQAAWHPYVSEIRGQHALGEVRECSIRINGKPGSSRENCTVLDVNNEIAWRIEEDSSGFSRMVRDWTAGFRLEPASDDAATAVTAYSEFRPRRWFVRLMLPVIRRRFHQTQRDILAALQRHLEQAAG